MPARPSIKLPDGGAIEFGLEMVALASKCVRLVDAANERHLASGHATRAAVEKCSLCRALAAFTDADRHTMRQLRLWMNAPKGAAGATR